MVYFSLWKKRSTNTIGYAYPPIPFQLPSVKQYLEASNPREKECFTAVQMIRKYLTQGNIRRAGGRKRAITYLILSMRRTFRYRQRITCEHQRHSAIGYLTKASGATC